MGQWDLQVIFCYSTIEPGFTDTYTILSVPLFAYSSIYVEKIICNANIFLSGK